MYDGLFWLRFYGQITISLFLQTETARQFCYTLDHHELSDKIAKYQTNRLKLWDNSFKCSVEKTFKIIPLQFLPLLVVIINFVNSM